jgi:hypothetical protein
MTTFTDLPRELQEVIANQLPLACDVARLSGSCKTLRTESFAEAYWHERWTAMFGTPVPQECPAYMLVAWMTLAQRLCVMPSPNFGQNDKPHLDTSQLDFAHAVRILNRFRRRHAFDFGDHGGSVQAQVSQLEAAILVKLVLCANMTTETQQVYGLQQITDELELCWGTRYTSSVFGKTTGTFLEYAQHGRIVDTSFSIGSYRVLAVVLNWDRLRFVLFSVSDHKELAYIPWMKDYLLDLLQLRDVLNDVNRWSDEDGRQKILRHHTASPDGFVYHANPRTRVVFSLHPVLVTRVEFHHVAWVQQRCIHTRLRPWTITPMRLHLLEPDQLCVVLAEQGAANHQRDVAGAIANTLVMLNGAADTVPPAEIRESKRALRDIWRSLCKTLPRYEQGLGIRKAFSQATSLKELVFTNDGHAYYR